MAGLIFIVAMFVLLWVLWVLPQRRRANAQRELLTSVTVGDEILTVGGLYGNVRAIEDDELTVEIAPGTVVRVARRAVAAVVPPEEETPVLEEGEVLEQDEEVRS